MAIGFVGCGLIARYHAQNLVNLTGDLKVDIGSVFDIDSSRALAFASDFKARTVASSAQDVIANCDAVYVCTWTSAHPEIVALAAEAGRGVFCEKPLAVDYETALTMAEMAAGVPNQVGLVLRNSPAFRWLAHRVTAGDTGSVMNIVFRDDQYLPTQGLYGSTWRADKAKAGAGTLLEHSIHDLDLLRWMMGPIDTVSAISFEHHELDGIEDSITVTLQAASGAQASLVSVWHEVLSRPSQRRVEVFCRDAVLTVAGDWDGPCEAQFTDSTEGPFEAQELADLAIALDGQHRNPDGAFVAAIQAGITPSPSFQTAVDAHALADAAYRSAAQGGVPIVPRC